MIMSLRTHCQFDSSEVGEKLALMLLTKLDPTMEGCDVSGDSDLLPRYSKPKVLCAALPGRLRYAVQTV